MAAVMSCGQVKDAVTALSFAAPNLYIRVFMSPTPEILAIAPAIIRTYALSFLLLPFNIFSTYYFQAMMKPSTASKHASGCVTCASCGAPWMRIHSQPGMRSTPSLMV